jgi:hypothetical protein
MREDQEITLVTLGIQKGSSDQVALHLAIQRNLKRLHNAALDDPFQFSLRAEHFDGLVVIPKEKGIVIAESCERVAGLDIVIGMRCLAEDGCCLESGKGDDDGLALVGVDLVQQLQVLLVGGERHGV